MQKLTNWEHVTFVDPHPLAPSPVTMNLVNGFSFGRPVWYMPMDANDPVVAAIEGATFAPALQRIEVGGDDSFSSAVERIFIAVNKPQQNGCANPQRQGLFAALTDGFRPNNVLGGIPTIALDYSPLWDANLYEWTIHAGGDGCVSLDCPRLRFGCPDCATGVSLLH